jgi:hypothetical protein
LIATLGVMTEFLVTKLMAAQLHFMEQPQVVNFGTLAMAISQVL